MRDWRNGSRARFKIGCLRTWEFKSPIPHHVSEGKVLEPVVRKTTFSRWDSGPVLQSLVVLA